MENMQTKEQCGRKQTPATKKKISKAMSGSGNSQWKDGRREEPRKKKGLKKGDKRIVHHIDGDRWNNKKSNLKVESRSKHDSHHKRNLNFKSKGGTKPPRRHALRN